MNLNQSKKLISYHLQAKKGFTLIELLMVMAIVGIMATLLSGQYAGVVGNINLDEAATALIYDIRATQAKAMNGVNNNGWGICFRNPSGEGGDLYEIVSPTSTCAAGTASSTVQSTIYLPNGVVFTTPADNAAKLIFFNKISGTTTADSVTLSYKNQTRIINITALGQVY